MDLSKQEDGAYVALNAYKGTPLDMRHSKHLGAKLAKEINEAVRGFSSGIYTPLPDKLILTPLQYSSLDNEPELLSYYDQTGELLQGSFLYRTKHNIMDVEVQEKF